MSFIFFVITPFTIGPAFIVVIRTIAAIWNFIFAFSAASLSVAIVVPVFVYANFPALIVVICAVPAVHYFIATLIVAFIATFTFDPAVFPARVKFIAAFIAIDSVATLATFATFATFAAFVT